MKTQWAWGLKWIQRAKPPNQMYTNLTEHPHTSLSAFCFWIQCEQLPHAPTTMIFKTRSHIVERGVKINPSFLKLFCQIFGQVMRKQLIYRLMYIKVWSPGSVSTHTILCPSLSFLKCFCSGSNLTSPSTFVLVLSDPIRCH